jgi:hypothetical protein
VKTIADWSLLNDTERKQVQSLAEETLFARCGEDSAVLESLIRDQCAAADVARAAVWEKCQSDVGYLRSVVRSSVATLHESQILAFLETSLGRREVARRLGFDPWDPVRERQLILSHRFVNSRRQKAVLIAGALPFVLMGLFPPILRQQITIGQWFIVPEDRVESQEFVGYRFLFAVEKSVRNEGRGPDLPGLQYYVRGHETRYAIALGRLLAQWAVLLLVVACLTVVLRDRRSFAQRM